MGIGQKKSFITKAHIKKALAIVFQWLGKQMTFTKLLIVFLLYEFVGWINQSYALAWADKGEIAEGLSETVMSAGVGVIIGYLAKSVFEHLSENNNWPDKTVIANEIKKAADIDAAQGDDFTE